MTLTEQLLETWAIHDRITRYLLSGLPDDALAGTPAGGKGRSVGELFAHIHNVRLMWLKAADPGLLAGLEKIEKERAADRAFLDAGLAVSGVAIGVLLERGLAEGRIKGFKPHAPAFLGYLISHESHHRGEIEITLTQTGFKLEQKVSYGLWEWGVRQGRLPSSRWSAS